MHNFFSKGSNNVTKYKKMPKDPEDYSITYICTYTYICVYD